MLKLCVLILMSTVAYVYSAVAIYRYQPKPAELADQEGCYIKDLNMVLPYNEPYYPKGEKSCQQYICQTNNETKLNSCGAIALQVNCHLEYDYTLDYPKCCGTPVCDPTTTTEQPTTEPPTTETSETEGTSVTDTKETPKGPTPPKTPTAPQEPISPESPKAPESPKTPRTKIPKVPHWKN
ncbi:little elongation complex subunit 2-like [Cydia pomonella]|uniref:little elongation complex subunit 2-like n=1 Tax=Cydia pomonella TaxID=82600 RepID=UPI002ADE0A18|nr:little elongation complex subunit 2-like [Cydia pomonella]